LRFVVSQRLIPRIDNSARVPVVEISKAPFHALDGPRNREVLFENVRDRRSDSVTRIDAEIEKLVRSGVIDIETALTHASDARQLEKSLGDFKGLASAASN
jgi:Tfp pilus assembly ATPase PilU